MKDDCRGRRGQLRREDLLAGRVSAVSERAGEKTLVIGGIDLPRAELTFSVKMSDLSKNMYEIFKRLQKEQHVSERRNCLCHQRTHADVGMVNKILSRQTSTSSKIYQVLLKG